MSRELYNSAEIGIYGVNSKSTSHTSDTIINEIARRLLSDIDGCPLFSLTWMTCVFDRLLEMLDDHALVDVSCVEAHEQCLKKSWNKKAVRKALAKCGDRSQCISEGV